MKRILHTLMIVAALYFCYSSATNASVNAKGQDASSIVGETVEK